MAKTPELPRKLTKSEAGRLGGMATKERHGIEHYRAAGKLGFEALAKRFGYAGGARKGAVLWLQGRGKVQPVRPATASQILDLYHQVQALAVQEEKGGTVPRPRLSREEATRRRREAALKGIAARAARPEAAAAPAEPGPPTARQILDRARALGIRRERDLYRRAHELRIGQRPGQWNPRARLALAAALAIWEARP